MYEEKDDYEFSEYPSDHPGYNSVNKKIIGKFKDELNSRTLLFNGKVKKNDKVINVDLEKPAAKGTKESAKKPYLRHTHYKKVLTNLSTITVKQNVIKRKSYSVSTYHQTNVVLTSFHTKRWICDDGIHTLAHGHRKTCE